MATQAGASRWRTDGFFAGEARRKGEFLVKEASGFKRFLLDELPSWPKEWRWALGKKLQAFGDTLCD